MIYILLLLLRNGSCSGEFAIFKLSLLLYGAEKYIAVIDINILFLRAFSYRLRIYRSFRTV